MGEVASVLDTFSVGSARQTSRRLTGRGPVYHERAGTKVLSGATTLDATHSGQILMIDTTATITLPSTAVGLTYHIVNAGADAAVAITVNPAAADKIMGAGAAGADNKDIVNTAVTARNGDYIKLFGDGVDGWFIQEIAGTWNREA